MAEATQASANSTEMTNANITWHNANNQQGQIMMRPAGLVQADDTSALEKTLAPDLTAVVQEPLLQQRGFRWHLYTPGQKEEGAINTGAPSMVAEQAQPLALPMPNTEVALVDITAAPPAKRQKKGKDASWKWCSFPDCNKYVVSKRLCIAHGGGKRCKIEGCTKSGQVIHLPSHTFLFILIHDSHPS